MCGVGRCSAAEGGAGGGAGCWGGGREAGPRRGAECGVPWRWSWRGLSPRGSWQVSRSGWFTASLKHHSHVALHFRVLHNEDVVVFRGNVRKTAKMQEGADCSH